MLLPLYILCPQRYPGSADGSGITGTIAPSRSLLFNMTALLRQSSHATQVIHFKRTIQWLLKDAQISATTTRINVRTFSSPQKEIFEPPHSPLKPTPAPRNHSSAFCIDLPILDISYRGNHTIHGLWCLAFSMQIPFHG